MSGEGERFAPAQRREREFGVEDGEGQGEDSEEPAERNKEGKAGFARTVEREERTGKQRDQGKGPRQEMDEGTASVGAREGERKILGGMGKGVTAVRGSRNEMCL